MCEIIEGQEYYIWSFNSAIQKESLMVATLFKCEQCKKPATVNGAWIMNNGTDLTVELLQANEIKKEHGELTELCSTEDGDSFCEHCYMKKSN